MRPAHQHHISEVPGAASKQDVTGAESRQVAVIADLHDQVRELRAEVKALREAYEDNARRVWGHIGNMPGGI